MDAKRSLSFSSTIRTSKGWTTASWQQSLSFSNAGNLTDAGDVQINTQSTTGLDKSSSGYSKSLNYPLWAYTAYGTFKDNYTIFAEINRGKDVRTIGQAVFPNGLESFASVQGIQSELSSFQGAALSTTQKGSATYLANETSSTSFSFGSTQQDMTFSGLEVDTLQSTASFPNAKASIELYHRHVSAVNFTVVEDEETLVDTSIVHSHLDLDNGHGFAAPGIKATLGRGPNGHRLA